MMIDLKHKRILITGASSGIGKALSFELAKRGAHLILSARRKFPLEKLSEQIQYKHPGIRRPLVFPCDLSKMEEIQDLFSFCRDQLGCIDILVNNAGIGVYGEATLISLEDNKRIMDVNYFGAVQCMLEAIPLLKMNGWGVIVNICSVAAIHGVPYLSAYGASKAALQTFSQSLQAELRRDRISLLIVNPGYTRTGFFRKEKKVGKAIRPDGPYAPVREVARSITSAMIHHRQQIVMSGRGKALAVIHGIFPGVVRKVMLRIANQLMLQT